MTNTNMILGAAVGLFLIARLAQLQKPANVVGPADQYTDGSNWYEDAWARLHGRDLSLDGHSSTPDGYDAYGMTGAMGWAYGWDGSISQVPGTV